MKIRAWPTASKIYCPSPCTGLPWPAEESPVSGATGAPRSLLGHRIWVTRLSPCLLWNWLVCCVTNYSKNRSNCSDRWVVAGQHILGYLMTFLIFITTVLIFISSINFSCIMVLKSRTCLNWKIKQIILQYNSAAYEDGKCYFLFCPVQTF